MFKFSAVTFILKNFDKLYFSQLFIKFYVNFQVSPRDRISFSVKDLIVIPKDESSLMVECTLEWTQDNLIHSSDLYVVINGVKSYVCTTSQFYYKFKSCMCKVSEIEFILSPNYCGKTLQSKLLKVPLNCD